MNYLIIAVAAVVLGCEPVIENDFELFTIRKGKHYCEQRHPESLQRNTLQFSAIFDSSAIYNFEQPGFQDSKNKLLGFSDCNSLHHENSARFAWQWFNNEIQIFAYCYANGERIEAFMGVVEPGENAHYEIVLDRSNYIFKFKGKEIKIARGADCSVGGYLLLWPYFGGQVPSPHDVTILIKRF